MTRPQSSAHEHSSSGGHVALVHLAGASISAALAAAAVVWALTDHAVVAGINAAVAAVLSAFLAGVELRRSGSVRDAGRPAWLVLGSVAAVAALANGSLGIGAARSSEGLTSADILALLPPEEEEKPETDDANRKLAEAYAPVLRLDRGEAFFPLGRDLYLAASDLRRASRGSDLHIPFTRLEELLPEAATCLPSCRYYLDVDGATPSQGARAYRTIQAELLGARPKLTVHWNVRTYPNGAVAIQYWFLYLFNDFVNKHESDWEHVTVYVLRREDGSVAPRDPDTIYLSAHEGGHKRPWKAVHKFAARPVVFVARGSHANYFEPGSPRVRPCEFAGCDRAPVYERVDGCGSVLMPAGETASTTPLRGDCDRLPKVFRYRLRRLVPPRFVGDYAKGNYIWIAPLKAEYPDPQLRDQWSDPFAEIAGAAVDEAFLQART